MQKAKTKKLKVAGHVPVVVDARKASAAGQASIEHLGNSIGGFLVECSKNEKELRAERLHLAAIPITASMYATTLRAEFKNKLINAFDAAKAHDLASIMAKNKTWQTPTLTALKIFSSIADSSLAHDPKFEYLPAQLQTVIRKSPGKWWSQFTKEDTASWRKLYELQLKIVKELYKAGAPFLAGSDNGAAIMILPGFGLHEELSLLVLAGLPPFKALQAATINPAVFLNKQKELGTVEVGKLADLVLLDANPLEDISNTRKINAVVANGRLLQRKDLDKLLEDARVQVKGK
ncbi:MAG: amidohydrolase family protein [Chitinophagaceae bacterium]